MIAHRYCPRRGRKGLTRPISRRDRPLLLGMRDRDRSVARSVPDCLARNGTYCKKWLRPPYRPGRHGGDPIEMVHLGLVSSTCAVGTPACACLCGARGQALPADRADRDSDSDGVPGVSRSLRRCPKGGTGVVNHNRYPKSKSRRSTKDLRLRLTTVVREPDQSSVVHHNRYPKSRSGRSTGDYD